jgi:hypothetical protein
MCRIGRSLATKCMPTPTKTNAYMSASGGRPDLAREYAFTDWITGFAEYNYYDFGTRSNTFITVGRGDIFDIVDVKEHNNVFKVAELPLGARCRDEEQRQRTAFSAQRGIDLPAMWPVRKEGSMR